MSPKRCAKLAEHFALVAEPRAGNAQRHVLLDILVIASCAVMCGAVNWVEIEAFDKAKRKWLKRFVELPKGLPSPDTFGRVFARLDPAQLQACFLGWVRALS